MESITNAELLSYIQATSVLCEEDLVAVLCEEVVAQTRGDDVREPLDDEDLIARIQKKMVSTMEEIVEMKNQKSRKSLDEFLNKVIEKMGNHSETPLIFARKKSFRVESLTRRYFFLIDEDEEVDNSAARSLASLFAFFLCAEKTSTFTRDVWIQKAKHFALAAMKMLVQAAQTIQSARASAFYQHIKQTTSDEKKTLLQLLNDVEDVAPSNAPGPVRRGRLLGVDRDAKNKRREYIEGVLESMGSMAFAGSLRQLSEEVRKRVARRLEADGYGANHRYMPNASQVYEMTRNKMIQLQNLKQRF